MSPSDTFDKGVLCSPGATKGVKNSSEQDCSRDYGILGNVSPILESTEGKEGVADVTSKLNFKAGEL